MKAKTLCILFIIVGSIFSCEILDNLDNEIPTIEFVRFNGSISELASELPISGATVTVVDQPDIEPVLTGTDGLFTFTDLRLDDGTYPIKITHPDYAELSTVFTIEGGTLKGEINVEMVPTGGIELSLQVLDFGAGEEQASISVRNISNSARNVEVSFDIPWLQASESALSIEANQSKSVAFTVDRSAADIGSYEEIVSFSVPGVPAQELVVKMQKLDPNSPILSLAVDSVDFGAASTSQNLTISNEGLSTLNWSVAASESWVAVSSTNGSIEPSQNASLEITVARDGFVTNGDYSATLNFSGNGGTGTVTVNVSVEGLSGGPNEDDDNDGIINSVDADDDNDGLIEINTIDDLNNIRNDLTAAGTGLVGAPSGGFTGYELTRNLDFDNDASYEDVSLKSGFTSGSGWMPIGTRSDRFNTIFEGNGFTISKLFINRTSQYNGLFGYSDFLSEVRNLNIEIRFLSGDDYSAGLLGFSMSEITNCSVKGNIQASSASSIGLLVGWHGSGKISNCYATGEISGNSQYCGGLIGTLGSSSSDFWEVENCHADVIVSGSNRVGGFVGATYWGDGAITSCYATGNISATESYVGGFIGFLSYGSISNCYATGNAISESYYIGGFVGGNSRTITSSYSLGSVQGSSNIGGFAGNSGSIPEGNYWDTTTSGISESDGGTGLTTAQLQGVTSNIDIYITWSADAWDFGTATQYPALKDMPNGLEAQR